jgi:putative phosphoribosyl transferase
MLVRPAPAGQRGPLVTGAGVGAHRCHHQGVFADRVDAGRLLAEALRGRLPSGVDAVVLGIPRGGVIVAEQVALALGAPLDVVVPRKVGAPHNPELAIGAVALGVRVWDASLLRRLAVPDDYRERAAQAEEEEIRRRTDTYRGARAPLELRGRIAVLVDDGIATGATATAAARWAKAAGAARLILAVPVAAPSSVARLARQAVDVVALEQPSDLRSVGEWYERFGQTSDDEVVAALARSWESG